MMLKLNFVAYHKCLVMGKIQLHKVNAIAGIRRVSENAKKDIIVEFKTKQQNTKFSRWKWLPSYLRKSDLIQSLRPPPSHKHHHRSYDYHEHHHQGAAYDDDHHHDRDDDQQGGAGQSASSSGWLDAWVEFWELRNDAISHSAFNQPQHMMMVMMMVVMMVKKRRMMLSMMHCW